MKSLEETDAFKSGTWAEKCRLLTETTTNSVEKWVKEKRGEIRDLMLFWNENQFEVADPNVISAKLNLESMGDMLDIFRKKYELFIMVSECWIKEESSPVKLKAVILYSYHKEGQSAKAAYVHIKGGWAKIYKWIEIDEDFKGEITYESKRFSAPSVPIKT